MLLAAASVHVKCEGAKRMPFGREAGGERREAAHGNGYCSAFAVDQHEEEIPCFAN